jgi:hypothetical protein
LKAETRKLKIVFHAAAMFLLAVSGFAADVQMNIQPELISLLDRAVLRVEFIDCKGNAVTFPDIDGLKIQYQGQSSQTRIVNMKSTSKVVHTYIVTPSKVGDYTIGPVTAKFKGGEKELTTQLRVIKPKDDKEAQEISELMYSRISSSREAPHVHEPFDLELKVFVRDGMQINGSFGINGGVPESGLDGELQWRVTDRTRKAVNGAIFNVYTLKTTAKTLTAGTFVFQPQVQLSVVIPRQQRRSYGFDDPFFGDFFGRQETRPFVLDCNRLEIGVRPVPMEGRPETYTGGVGIFDFDVDVGPTKVKAGEPITVKMRIAGNGNLSQITPPEITDSHNFKLYDARSVPSGNSNEVLFEQVLIPTSDSVSNVPAIAFTYFNTKTTDFRTINQGPFPVTVEAVPRQAAQIIATVPSTIQQETKVLGRDIVYLKPVPKVWRSTTDVAWHRKTATKILVPIPALLLALAAGVSARRNRLASNQALARRQKAPKAARQNIQRAEQAMRHQHTDAFYEAAWDTLTEYFGHRLNLPPGEVTLQTVTARIPDEQEAIQKLFSEVEQKRYGIVGDKEHSKEEMKALLREMTAVLKKCERMKR